MILPSEFDIADESFRKCSTRSFSSASGRSVRGGIRQFLQSGFAVPKFSSVVAPEKRSRKIFDLSQGKRARADLGPSPFHNRELRKRCLLLAYCRGVPHLVPPLSQACPPQECPPPHLYLRKTPSAQSKRAEFGLTLVLRPPHCLPQPRLAHLKFLRKLPKDLLFVPPALDPLHRRIGPRHSSSGSKEERSKGADESLLLGLDRLLLRRKNPLVIDGRDQREVYGDVDSRLVVWRKDVPNDVARGLAEGAVLLDEVGIEERGRKGGDRVVEGDRGDFAEELAATPLVKTW